VLHLGVDVLAVAHMSRKCRLRLCLLGDHSLAHQFGENSVGLYVINELARASARRAWCAVTRLSSGACISEASMRAREERSRETGTSCPLAKDCCPGNYATRSPLPGNLGIALCLRPGQKLLEPPPAAISAPLPKPRAPDQSEHGRFSPSPPPLVRHICTMCKLAHPLSFAILCLGLSGREPQMNKGGLNWWA
jgi:hypothetical protein